MDSEEARAVRYQKALLTFWQDVYRWRRLSK